MQTNQFEILETVIKGRRTTGWAKMNGKSIPDETVTQLLGLAHWAPTHGRTEPWQFLVYGGESRFRFGKDHAQLYWDHTAEDKRQEATREKLEHNVDLASHLVVAVMKLGENPRIPQVEEVSAASAAIQNILLGATALGIASFWSSGGMTHHHALKEFLGLGHDDIILGLLYLGYSDEPAKEGVRNSQVEDKVKWM